MQAVVTTADPQVTLQQPAIVTGSKVKANPPILKVASGGQGKGPAGKVKGTKPPNKGRKMWLSHQHLKLSPLLVHPQVQKIKLKTNLK